MEEQLPKRRKKTQKAERAKRGQRIADIKERAARGLAQLAAALKIAAVLLLLFTVFVIASLYTSWTGNFGAKIAALLLTKVGGAVIIPLLFLLYALSSSLLSRGRENFYRHLCSSAAIFLLLSLLFGLNFLTADEEEARLCWNSAGSFGALFSLLIYRTTGVVGTFIIGALLLYLILFAYNIHVLSYIKLPKLPLLKLPEFKLALPRLRKGDAPSYSDADIADGAEAEEAESAENENEEDAGAEAPYGKEAPNISEFEEGDYFAYGEEKPEGFCERGSEGYDNYRHEEGRPRARYRITKVPDSSGTEYKFTREPGEEADADVYAAWGGKPKPEASVFERRAAACGAAETLEGMPTAGRAEEGFDDLEIDYNDPESVRRAEESEAAREGASNTPAVVQDPSFNYGDEGGRRIRQGIFPPPIEIFGPAESRDGEMDEERAAPLGGKIVSTLAQFGIESHLAEILVGPTVIQFRIQLAPGVKVSKVAALSNDIALSMAVSSLRIEAPIPGKPYVGIEIPNPKRRGIPLRTVVEADAFAETKLSLPLPFGVAVNGDPVVVGLEELPHLLVAGTTGSGKSVFINSCIVGLCSKRTPEELRMILVDPKRVEMAVYDRLPHLLTPPVTDPKKAVQALAWLIREMEKRYTTFAKLRVRNLEGYNERVLPKDRIYHIVIVVDELADLMMTAPKEVEEYICRLAQMARATGIHLMLATQRPSVNIITGLIKANIPARVAFTLPSNADSRTIIDCAGAEKLLGKGDMLFSSTKHPKPLRVQSPWIADQILADWLAYMTNTFGEPEFIKIEDQGNGASGGNGGDYDDELLQEALETVMSTGIASASGLQRRLRVGFSRASRLIDMMEQLGIVGAADGARPREILVDEETAKELLEDAESGGSDE